MDEHAAASTSPAAGSRKARHDDGPFGSPDAVSPKVASLEGDNDTIGTEAEVAGGAGAASGETKSEGDSGVPTTDPLREERTLSPRSAHSSDPQSSAPHRIDNTSGTSGLARSGEDRDNADSPTDSR
eukprot:1094088-Pyramimonas_sp.AAC.1